jgi:hypothetical protein
VYAAVFGAAAYADDDATEPAVLIAGGDMLQILDDAYWVDENNVSRRQTNIFRFVGKKRDILRVTDLRAALMHGLAVSPTGTKVFFVRSGSTARLPQEMLCIYDVMDMRLIKVPLSVGRAEWSADGMTIAVTARSLHRGSIGAGKWVALVDAQNGNIIAGKRIREQ